MKLPRDVSGEVGLRVTRQTGSRMRLTHRGREGTHHLTVPRHRELKVGTLSGIIKDVAQHLSLPPEEVTRTLWTNDG